MKVIVTGATGFVGLALIRRLRFEGVEVLALSRKSVEEFNFLGVKTLYCDLANLNPSDNEILKCFEGVDTVFHVASKVGIVGKYEEFYSTNVLGTKSILSICKTVGVKNFIYTSSPSVVAGRGNLNYVNETQPYPRKYLSFYPQTKALAEKEVIATGIDKKLRTIALRPHVIWGPNDQHIIPRILSRAKAQSLIQIGNGENLSDTTFIDDCVEAHILAAKFLNLNPNLSGRVYFITQDAPVNLWAWINKILKHNNLPQITRKIPASVAYFVASIVEASAKLQKSEKEPFLTRFLVHQMSSTHTFDISAAKRDLAYKPKYSIDEAMELTFGKR